MVRSKLQQLSALTLNSGSPIIFITNHGKSERICKLYPNERPRTVTGTPRPDDPADPVEALLQQLRADALISEAQALAHGIRHLSIAHGQPETDEEMSRLQTFTERAWAITGDAHTPSMRGGNDYLTVTVHGEGAADAVNELQALAEALNPGWWRITQSTQPF